MPDFMGNCHCGKIQFYCDGNPFFTQYCHCNKCREVASRSGRHADTSGYAWTAGYLTSRFHITSGKEALDEIIRNNSKLYLCKACHTLVYGMSRDPAMQAGIGVNANNFQFADSIPESFKPVRHIYYINRIVDFDDNLPKFKDAPKEQFGSGELYAPSAE